MHKGRIVPHHPSFWVGQNYFWPSYVSWKVMLSALQSFHFPDFPDYAPSTPRCSQAGVVIDEHSIYWEWNVDWTTLCDRIRITLADHLPRDPVSSQFHAEMFVGSTLVDECWWYEFQGVNTWNVGVFTAYKTPTIDPFSPWGGAQLFQATYAQGGSPFP